MFVIRPITLQDLATLGKFADATQAGMLSLPKNRTLLKSYIQSSINSFQKHAHHPHDEIYMFALEDTVTGEIGGSCGIHAKAGMGKPLYFFRVASEEHQLLYPAIIRNGPTELCALYLTPEWRKKHLGRLLSFSRLLFIAGNDDRFDKTVIASLRGVLEGSISPFWEGLGKNLVELPFEEAVTLNHSQKDWIEKRLPKYPIYVSLLSRQVKRILGKANLTSRPALKMLMEEGFQLSQWIDMFDGGPVVTAPTKNIQTIKTSHLATVQEITREKIQSETFIMSNDALDFRACCGHLQIITKNRVVIRDKLAKALQIQKGGYIRYAILP